MGDTLTGIFLVLAVYAGALLLYFWLCRRIAEAAQRKGRSYKAWHAIALLANPIFAAIAVACMADRPDPSALSLAGMPAHGRTPTLATPPPVVPRPYQSPAPPPVLSPDGRFYWDGSSWHPMPAGAVPTA
jgi:hypothetical protein